MAFARLFGKKKKEKFLALCNIYCSLISWSMEHCKAVDKARKTKLLTLGWFQMHR